MFKIDYSNDTITPKTSFYDKMNGILIVNPEVLRRYAETISTDENCRYPQLTLRLFVYLLTEIDKKNKLSISARQIAKEFGVHYDTVTKCLKYLRSINVIGSDN